MCSTLAHLLLVLCCFFKSTRSEIVGEIYLGEEDGFHPVEDYSTMRETIDVDIYNSIPIFVSISSFRDGDRCGKTLEHLFRNASFPSRLHVSILQQHAAEDVSCITSYKQHLPELQCDKTCAQVAVTTQPHVKASGPITSRVKIQQMQRKARETWRKSAKEHHLSAEIDPFVMQLDSHMSFTYQWDKELIASWARTGNKKAVLSTYVADFNQDPTPRHICRTSFTQEGVPTILASVGIKNAVRPIWSGLFSGHFAFGPSKALLDDVPYDGNYENMFYGEELMMAARLFTHGYDTYSPDVSVVMHDYTGSFHMRPWRWDYLNLAHSLKRCYHLFNMSGGEVINGYIPPELGMGHQRPLKDWLQLVGMDFTTRTVFRERQCRSSVGRLSLEKPLSDNETYVDPAAHRRPYLLPVFGRLESEKVETEINEMIRFAENIWKEESDLQGGLEVNPMVLPNLVLLHRKRLERFPTIDNHRLAMQLLLRSNDEHHKHLESNFVVGSGGSCDSLKPAFQSRCALEFSRLYLLLGEDEQAIRYANYSISTAVLNSEKADALTARGIALEHLIWKSSTDRSLLVLAALKDIDKALFLDATCPGAHRIRVVLLREKYLNNLIVTVPLIGSSSNQPDEALEAFTKSLELASEVLKNRPPLIHLVGIDLFEDSLILHDLHTALALAHDAMATLTPARSYHAEAARGALKLGNGYLNAAQREGEPSIGVEDTCMAVRMSKYAAKMKTVFRKPSIWRALHGNSQWHSAVVKDAVLTQSSLAPVFVLGGRSCGGETLITALTTPTYSMLPTHGIELLAPGKDGLASGSGSVFGTVAEEVLGRISTSLARGDSMADLLRVVSDERDMVLSLLRNSSSRSKLKSLTNQDRVLDYGDDLWLHAGVIHLLFPDSPLLHVPADVTQCALELYQGSALSLSRPNWALSLASVVHVISQRESLVAHWSSVIGSKLFLLTPDKNLASALMHCGIVSPPSLSKEEERRQLDMAIAKRNMELHASGYGAHHMT